MIERRVQVREVVGIFGRRKPAAGDPLLELTFGHSGSPFLVLPKG
jgi:hypothetical protein